MCDCPAHDELVDCTCTCDHTADRLLQWRKRALTLARTLQRVREALAKANAMQPDNYRTGQDHLPRAFREVDYQRAFLDLIPVVNEIEAALDEERA